MLIANLFPDKKLYGLDWARSSRYIIQKLQEKQGWKIEGFKFDFFEPRNDIKLDVNSGIYIFGALEQTGEKWSKFLEYIIEQKPKICVNIECLYELYDDNNSLDYIAIKYHEKRNYLKGYLPELQDLEKKELLKL